ncbi:hypothetical protein T492DRAFT_525786 [Pavlovales sp. CCMP2436]|nr:hypothetical protein T492DRAFT_525786 [Pavlovales sp. CCMP2436]
MVDLQGSLVSKQPLTFHVIVVNGRQGHLADSHRFKSRRCYLRPQGPRAYTGLDSRARTSVTAATPPSPSSRHFASRTRTASSRQRFRPRTACTVHTSLTRARPRALPAARASASSRHKLGLLSFTLIMSVSTRRDLPLLSTSKRAPTRSPAPPTCRASSNILLEGLLD